MSNSSPWFALSSYTDTKSFFEFPIDYIVNAGSRNRDFRTPLLKASQSRYAKAMLSPKYFIDGTHNVYGVTCSQISDEEVRKDLMNGFGLAHRTFGDVFIDVVLDVFGLHIGSVLLAESYHTVNEAFYKRNLIHASPLEMSRPYDFRPYYLATFIANLELHYPRSFSMKSGAMLMYRLKLPMEELSQIADRVHRTTGRPEIVYTLH